jgi:hypothetical protein
MRQGLRLPKWAMRTKPRTSRQRQSACGISPNHRRLVVEPLEDRRLLSVTAVVAPFAPPLDAISGLTANQTISYTAVQATAAAPAVTTDSSNATPAVAATQLSFITPYGGYPNQLTDAPFTLVVVAVDPSGTIDTSFNGDVTLTLAHNPSGATLGGGTVTAVDGVARFTALTIDKAGISYTLQATSGGLTGTSAPITVTDELAVTTQPSTTIAGVPFTMVTTVEDGLGKVVSSFNGSVTVSNYLGNGGSLGGTRTVNAVNGVATFSDLTLNQTTSYAMLQVTAEGLTDTTGYFSVTAAPATQLSASTPSGSMLADAPFSLTVYAKDPYGNVDYNFSGSVMLALASGPAGAHLGGTIPVNAVYGEATFPDLTLDQAGSYTLQATSAPLAASTTDPFAITDQLVVTTQPSNVIAGSAFGLVATVEDGLGVAVSSFNGSVTVKNYFGADTLAGTLTVNAVNGVATFSGLTTNQAIAYAQLQVIANDLGLTALTGDFSVTAATATQLSVSPPYGSLLAAAPFSVAVYTKDPFGNTDTSFSGNVTLALANNPSGATLGGPDIVTVVDGVANFLEMTISKAGSGYTLQATSDGLTTGTSSPFAITDQLVVTTQPPGSVTAGAAFGLVAEVEDGLRNVVSSYNGNVTLSNEYDGGILGGTLTVSAVNGVATFSGLTLNQTTDYTVLQVTAAGLMPVTTSSFMVTPAPATQLWVSPLSGNLLVGAPFKVTVYAEDPFGNTDTSFYGSVTLVLANNPSGATLGGETINVPVVNGVANFSGLTIDKAAGGYRLQATSSSLTPGNSALFAVTDQLVVTTQPPGSVTAGIPFPVVATVEDGLGNVVSSFNGSVTVSNEFNADTLAGTLTVNAVNGVATFSGLTLDQATDYAALQVTAAGLAATTGSFSVTSAAATRLSVSSPSGKMLVGAPFSLTVSANDPFGNTDLSFNGSVTLALASGPSDATLGGTVTVTAVNGVASFSLTLDKVGYSYVLQATSGELIAGTTAPFAVTDQLIVTSQPPASVAAGAPFGLAVALEDGLGNVVSSFNGSVTVNNDSGSILGGTLIVNAVNGVATFSGLTLSKAATSVQLQVTADDLTATTGSFNVTALAATKLSASAPSGNVLVGAPFSLTVYAKDRYGNTDLSFNGSVTLAFASNPSGATLGGTHTVTAVNGVASFSGLTIDKTGSGYKLRSTSAPLTAGTTAAFDVTGQLVMANQPPASVTIGVPFGLAVAVEDGLGNVVSSFNGSVTVSLDGADGGTLGGTLTVNAVNGMATFSDLTLSEATDYAQLQVTAAGLTPATTGFFSVNAVVAPTVTNVLVDGTNWNSTFLSYLASLDPQNVGGYSIPVGSGSQLVTLPWANINQIKVVFSEDVVVDQSDLLLSGVNTTAYNVSGGAFSYDPTTFTATWTLPQVIGSDKLLLQLNASGSDPIEDRAGNLLDGEWTNPSSTAQSSSSTYPSGDGAAGGDFDFRLNVLSGDATADGFVTGADLIKLLANYNQSGMTWRQGDFTGDGIVTGADLVKLLANYNKTLPSGEPVAGSFPAVVSLMAEVVPTVVSSASAISATPQPAADTPATSSSNTAADVVAIVSPDVVAPSQVAVPATSSGSEAVVPAVASVSQSVVTSQPVAVVSAPQPTAPLSLSARVSFSQSTVTVTAAATAPLSIPPLTESVQPVASGAIARGASASSTAAAPQKLAQVPLVMGALPGSSLAEAAGNLVALDTNAAGNGWLVDSAPAWDQASTPSPNTQPLPVVDPRVVDRTDLVTVATHELEQVTGFNDLDAVTDDVMSSVGKRRDVTHVDTVLASL